MTSSNTTSFNPSNADLTLTAFRRVGVRSSAITNEHMVSARMAINLVQAAWSNMGVNLWRVDLQTVPLVQSVATYGVPSDTVMVLDAYIRIFALGSPVNESPAFTTTTSSSSVTVYLPASGLSVGNWVSIVIPVSVGGLIIYGLYQVNSVLDSNHFTIIAASNATGSITAGGLVPLFTTTQGSATVNVLLNNHGYLAGQSFLVQVATTIGGITILGSYTIPSVVDANNFTITASSPATSSQNISENNGQAQITPQNTSAQPVDRILNPISRTDYASLPDKVQQGFPTTMWFDRLINPTLTLWEVPDGNGPYELLYYRVSQLQDESPTMGQTPNIPYRFLDALVSDLAWYLAKEWNPQIEMQRKEDADIARALAMAEDRERVGLYVTPDFSSYYS